MKFFGNDATHQSRDARPDPELFFTYRDLPSWLNNPTETPPLIPDLEQLSLPLPAFGQHVSRIG